MKRLICLVLTMMMTSLCIASCGSRTETTEAEKAPDVTGDVIMNNSDKTEQPEDTPGSAPETNKIDIPSDTMAQPNSQPAIGGSYGCPIHDTSFHEMSADFIGERMTEENIRAWGNYAVEKNKELGIVNDCPYSYCTIKQFIDDNGFTREEVEEAYSNCFICVHDIDLLFDGTNEEIEAYYRDVDARETSYMRQMRLSDIYDSISYKAKNEGITETPPRILSIIELVKYYDIDRETLENIITDEQERWKKKNIDEKYLPNLNLDLIYGGNGVEAISINDGQEKPLDRWKLDSLLCGVDDIRIN